MTSWSESIRRAMDRVHTTWAGIIKHLLDRTSPNIIFIWSGEVILGLGFASPNITLPDQINMILVSVLSNKCILGARKTNKCLLLFCKIKICICYYSVKQKLHVLLFCETKICIYYYFAKQKLAYITIL